MTNPFFSNLPVVSIVTNVKVVNGVSVETPLVDCVRVWGRIGVGVRLDNTLNSPLVNSANTRFIPDPQGIDKQQPF